LEKLYHHELRQRKTIEEALSIQRREMEETRIKCKTMYEELHDAGEEHAILEQCITELKSARDDEKQKLEASKNLVEELRADKEKLQQERDATAEELRPTKKEQRVSVPAAEAVINTEFSASELEQATRSFDEALKIGEGGFGCGIQRLTSQHNRSNQADAFKEPAGAARIQPRGKQFFRWHYQFSSQSSLIMCSLTPLFVGCCSQQSAAPEPRHAHRVVPRGVRPGL
jgi:hypothetical protein